uniref:Protein SMG9 n=1 Tax=Quercus lobata TaxID=97700 RepID=A0A7N2MI96_QUELO
MARHCSMGMGIETRISSERIILLDTQPVFSPSVLSEIMRPDGSSTISVLSGESLSAELAHELMSIQLGVLLASICNILLVVSDGVHDNNMWRLMLTVDLLKHGIPDPSSLIPADSLSSNLGPEKENKDKVHESEEYMVAPVFVHTKLHDQDLTPHNIVRQRKAILQYFGMSSFMRDKSGNMTKDQPFSSVASVAQSIDPDSAWPNLFVLFMKCPLFARTVSERDWLKNDAKIWELVKSSPIIAEYSKTLQSSGMFRR